MALLSLFFGNLRPSRVAERLEPKCNSYYSIERVKLNILERECLKVDISELHQEVYHKSAAGRAAVRIP